MKHLWLNHRALRCRGGLEESHSAALHPITGPKTSLHEDQPAAQMECTSSMYLAISSCRLLPVSWLLADHTHELELHHHNMVAKP